MNLTGEQYWKWRYLISKMETCKSDMRVKTLEVKLAEAQVKILAANSKEIYSVFNESKTDYNNYKLELEKIVGETLNGKVIDDYTYEIKDLTMEGE